MVYRVSETARIAHGVILVGSVEVGVASAILEGAHVGEEVSIGRWCVVGRRVVMGREVRVGDKCLIGTGTILAEGTQLEDGVHIGPGVVLRNELAPRALYSDGTMLLRDYATARPVRVREGATIHSGVVVNAGVTVGRYALVEPGTVVADDVPDHGHVAGHPARLIGQVCTQGHPLAGNDATGWRCATCGEALASLTDEGEQER